MDIRNIIKFLIRVYYLLNILNFKLEEISMRNIRNMRIFFIFYFLWNIKKLVV